MKIATGLQSLTYGGLRAWKCSIPMERLEATTRLSGNSSREIHVMSRPFPRHNFSLLTVQCPVIGWQRLTLWRWPRAEKPGELEFFLLLHLALPFLFSTPSRAINWHSSNISNTPTTILPNSYYPRTPLLSQWLDSKKVCFPSRHSCLQQIAMSLETSSSSIARLKASPTCETYPAVCCCPYRACERVSHFGDRVAILNLPLQTSRLSSSWSNGLEPADISTCRWC